MENKNLFSRIHIREILAWMTLAIAIILFSVTIAFAQTKSISVNSEDGKVHLKIKKTENGKTVNIDTTFQVTDDSDIEKIINDLGYGDDEQVGSKSKKRSNIYIHNDDGSDKKEKEMSMDFDFPGMSEADMEKLHENLNQSMHDMNKGLERMKESLGQMHIHINNDLNNGDFNFNFDSPDIDSLSGKSKHKKGYSYDYSFNSDDASDSLKDKENVVIIMGDKNENPPVLEKVIKSKDGKQVFIYKRSGNESASKKSAKEFSKEKKSAAISGLNELRCYPNPTLDKFTLSFICEKESDLTIKVIDGNSKEVYSEKLNDFSGEYSKEIDLSGKSKGNYFVKISSGNQAITKKIILN